MISRVLRGLNQPLSRTTGGSSPGSLRLRVALVQRRRSVVTAPGLIPISRTRENADGVGPRPSPGREERDTKMAGFLNKVTLVGSVEHPQRALWPGYAASSRHQNRVELEHAARVTFSMCEL